MKVNGFQVKWFYGTSEKNGLEYTEAIVFKQPQEAGVTPTERVAAGKTFLAKGDAPNRDKGRKIALKRALQDIFTKDERKAFWETYRTMTKVPRWGEPLPVVK